jgi:tape measure domain-containing protein
VGQAPGLIFDNAALGPASQPGGELNVTEPLQTAGRDFTREIQLAQARVDEFRALAIKDGNRNTQLRRELLPQAQQELDALKQEADMDRQRQEADLRAQALMTQAQSQQDFADTAVQRANIAADAQVQAAQVRDADPFPDQVGAGAGQQAIPQPPAGAAEQQEDQAAIAIAQSLQQGQLSEEVINSLRQTNPRLYQKVLLQLGLAQGQ